MPNTLFETWMFWVIHGVGIAVRGVTNHHKTRLRDSHQGHAALDPELADSFRFFSLGTRAYRLIENLCNQNRGFTRMLAGIRAGFNPIAAYYKNRRKAFEMAANGDADNVLERMSPDEYIRKGGAWVRWIEFPGPPLRREKS